MRHLALALTAAMLVTLTGLSIGCVPAQPTPLGDTASDGRLAASIELVGENADTGQYGPEDPLTIRFTVKNVSMKPLAVWEPKTTQGWAAYSLQLVPATRDQQETFAFVPCLIDGLTPTELAPGEAISVNLEAGYLTIAPDGRRRAGAIRIRGAYDTKNQGKGAAGQPAVPNLWKGRLMTGPVTVTLAPQTEGATASATQPTSAKTSFKGWEIYIWQEKGETLFALLPGTNWGKPKETIVKQAVKGFDALKPKLNELKAGEVISINGRGLGEAPPADQATIVTEYCKKIGLDVMR